MQLAGFRPIFPMAAPISRKRLLMVGALVVVVAMLATLPTEASSFTFFSGSCSESQAVLNACGCNTVPSNTHGAYIFTYTGQSAAAYNGAVCTGVAATRFQGSGAQQCSPVGWQSVFIQC